MKQENKKWNPSLWIWLFVVVVLEVLLIMAYADAYGDYRFPVVIDKTEMIKFIGICLILPLLSGVLFCICVFAKKKRASIVMLGLAMTTIVVAFVFHSAQSLFVPPICSSTQNPDDFGLYDERVAEMIDHCPLIAFPEKIPEDANNVQYEYFYSYASSELLYIAVSWQCPDEESLQDLIQNLPTGGVEIANYEGELVYHYLGDKYERHIYPYYVSAVIIDDHAKKVYYVAVHNSDMLPTSGKDVFRQEASSD